MLSSPEIIPLTLSAAASVSRSWTSHFLVRGLAVQTRRAKVDFLAMLTDPSHPPLDQSPNLGARILAITRRCLPGDWTRRRNITPVFMKTIVGTPRFIGVIYKASGWLHVGTTDATVPTGNVTTEIETSGRDRCAGTGGEASIDDTNVPNRVASTFTLYTVHPWGWALPYMQLADQAFMYDGSHPHVKPLVSNADFSWPHLGLLRSNFRTSPGFLRSRHQHDRRSHRLNPHRPASHCSGQKHR